MTKPIKWLPLVVVMALGLIGCEPTTTQSIADPTLIFGLWQEEDDGKLKAEYMRFLTAEQEAKEGAYFFGREWDEDDDVHERDLKYKGNGWFKWKIEGNTLTMIELMDNKGAEIPETYTIKSLTAKELVLQDRYDKSDTDTWRKK